MTAVYMGRIVLSLSAVVEGAAVPVPLVANARLVSVARSVDRRVWLACDTRVATVGTRRRLLVPLHESESARPLRS